MGFLNKNQKEMAQVDVCTSKNVSKKIFSEVNYFLAQEPSDQVGN